MNEHNLESYNYLLNESLIAKYPISPKSSAKLLVYIRDKDKIIHTTFKDFFDFIPKNCLIVCNNTKVIKARIYGYKQNNINNNLGAKIELLYHSVIDNNKFLVQIRGKVKQGDIIVFNNNLKATVLEIFDNGLRSVSFNNNNVLVDKNTILDILDSIGHMPLPPYIKRDNKINDDILDYQSIFAKNKGSIAAPTASLHFNKDDFARLKTLPHCFITLHIGAGTFFSIKDNDIRNHKMHKEKFFISQVSKNKIDNAKKILCIGTTATRCVEYYARTKKVKGKCDIFINPFNKPIKTNYILTNFHLPKSSLIMLIAGFIGLEKTKEIYQTAIKLNYRFYSYGDGMLIL